ncbi:MAG TPA: A24 family peptidase, partial [Candidatus Nanoarchaeia archaeon]|nr:A24 family peptidase [Candidatus Nanoarchaeia archaeon]
MSSIIYVLLNSFSGTELMLFAIALVALAIGSYTDFRKREVPDWMSYSFVFIALGIRLIYSAITFDWMFFVYGILGFFVFLGIALLMFYTGQWGGGDAKVLAGIGAAIGLKFSLDSMLIAFVINTIIIGGLYGLVYSFYLASRNRSKFFRKFWSLLSDKKIKSKQKTALIVTVLL